MSLERVQRLEQWLTEVLHVPTENRDVSIEKGNVVAYFDDGEPLIMGEPIIAPGDDTIEVPLFPHAATNAVGVRDRYSLIVTVRNHGADPLRLKLGLLRWLHSEGQGGNAPALDYDGVKNNQSTYDWFFELQIDEATRNVGAELRTC